MPGVLCCRQLQRRLALLTRVSVADKELQVAGLRHTELEDANLAHWQ